MKKLLLAILIGAAACTGPTYTDKEYNDMALSVYKNFELQQPYPVIKFVERNSKLLDSKEVGKAVIFEDDYRVIYIKSSEKSKRKFLSTIEHETAHHKTWERYGTNVEEHGFQFNLICGTYALYYDSCDYE